MKKNIAIIGSTGSIGRQTLEIVRANPATYKVIGLACGKNIGLLEKQIKEFNPGFVAVFDRGRAEILRGKMAGKKLKIFDGEAGLKKIAALPQAQKIVFASSGLAALNPLIYAIKANKEIALANKEVIVAAGETIMKLARKNGVVIVPVDSEHSAVFQCLAGEDPANVEKIILTCSGGPFYGKSRAELEKITVEQALKHPVWKMGKEISLDSATLMNKAFEVIEAAYLFNLRPEQIEVIIHPECVVHSMVQFRDGSIKALLTPPDMRYQIGYALSYPERAATNLPRLDFNLLKKLTFFKPDYKIFPGPKLAFEALRAGGNQPAALIYANHVARLAFLNHEISFGGIYPAIKKYYANIKNKAVNGELSI